MIYLLYFVSWFTCGWIASKMAARRGRNSNLWFALGFLLGIVGLGVLYFLPSKQIRTPAEKPSFFPPNPEEIAKAPPEVLWYYLDSDKNQHGPMSFHALKEAWDLETANASTYVWNEKMENWRRVEHLTDLHTKLQTPAR